MYFYCLCYSFLFVTVAVWHQLSLDDSIVFKFMYMKTFNLNGFFLVTGCSVLQDTLYVGLY